VDLYVQAEKDVLEGKSTTFNGRVMTMEDLDSIREGRKEWEQRVLDEAAQSQSKTRQRYSLASFN